MTSVTKLLPFIDKHYLKEKRQVLNVNSKPAREILL